MLGRTAASARVGRGRQCSACCPSPQICPSPDPGKLSVTLFGKRTAADETKLGDLRGDPTGFGVALNPTSAVLGDSEKDLSHRDTQRRGPYEGRAETRVMLLEAKGN